MAAYGEIPMAAVSQARGRTSTLRPCQGHTDFLKKNSIVCHTGATTGGSRCGCIRKFQDPNKYGARRGEAHPQGASTRAAVDEERTRQGGNADRVLYLHSSAETPTSLAISAKPSRGTACPDPHVVVSAVPD